jgi:hypothetical protein
MELTPAQRLITFAVVVLVLAGLGAYLFLGSGSDGANAAPKPGVTSSPSARPSRQPSSSPTGSPGGGPPRAGSPSHQVPDIYSWLPFTASGLASAAQVTTEFATDYGTYSYRQDATSYLKPMEPLITSELAGLIGRAFTTPGLVAQRDSGKQVSTGSAVITSLRAFGPTSLTFVVTVVQKIASAKGASQQTASYAITVAGGGTTWQVNDIEPALAGNQ